MHQVVLVAFNVSHRNLIGQYQPISAIWMNAEILLLHLKQDPEIAKLAGLYLRYLILGLPAYGFNCISRKFFQSQGLFSIQTQINLLVAPVNLLINFLLVWGPPSTRIGFIGAPIATSISYILISIISIIYGIFFTSTDTWHPLSLKMFSNLSILFRLGLAGAAQIASEWWAWELLALAASFIGNLLGKKNAKLASIAATAAIIVALIVSSTLRILDVVALVASVLPLIAFYQILDGVSAVTSGILRAKGRQDIGALLNFGSYYIVGLPLGIWLTFGWKMGLYGLWIGMTVALLCCAVVGTTICLRTDWEVEVLKATERLEEDCSQSIEMDYHA
ncbi:hypothetical protein H0H93_007345 [Arthromyces matolae]|nr:hypothetical protein H0H93_007345 [Arthromyces matolae]